jgi:hypothetical protein
MKMYKILTLALAAPLFVACGGSTPEAAAPEQPAAEAKKADDSGEAAKADEAAAPAEEAAAPAEEKAPAEAAPAEEKKEEPKKKGK